MGSIPRERAYWQKKCIAWMHCKSLWIKASAKCLKFKLVILQQMLLNHSYSSWVNTFFLPTQSWCQSRGLWAGKCHHHLKFPKQLCETDKRLSVFWDLLLREAVNTGSIQCGQVTSLGSWVSGIVVWFRERPADAQAFQCKSHISNSGFDLWI